MCDEGKCVGEESERISENEKGERSERKKMK